MLKQVMAELKCFERKINNLEVAIDTEDLLQIEIEFANIKNEFEAFQDEIYSVKEDIEDVEHTMFNVERLVPMTIVIG
jgi:FtsZ-binding cell division protein ZapB